MPRSVDQASGFDEYDIDFGDQGSEGGVGLSQVDSNTNTMPQSADTGFNRTGVLIDLDITSAHAAAIAARTHDMFPRSPYDNSGARNDPSVFTSRPDQLSEGYAMDSAIRTFLQEQTPNAPMNRHGPGVHPVDRELHSQRIEAPISPRSLPMAPQAWAPRTPPYLPPLPQSSAEVDEPEIFTRRYAFSWQRNPSIPGIATPERGRLASLMGIGMRSVGRTREAFLERHLKPVNAQDTDRRCAICYESYDHDEHVSVEIVGLPTCKGHIFGKSCLLEWLNTPESKSRDKSCPMCRTALCRAPRPAQFHRSFLGDSEEDQLIFEYLQARRQEISQIAQETGDPLLIRANLALRRALAPDPNGPPGVADAQNSIPHPLEGSTQYSGNRDDADDLIDPDHRLRISGRRRPRPADLAGQDQEFANRHEQLLRRAADRSVERSQQIAEAADLVGQFQDRQEALDQDQAQHRHSAQGIHEHHAGTLRQGDTRRTIREQVSGLLARRRSTRQAPYQQEEQASSQQVSTHEREGMYQHLQQQAHPSATSATPQSRPFPLVPEGNVASRRPTVGPRTRSQTARVSQRRTPQVGQLSLPAGNISQDMRAHSRHQSGNRNLLRALEEPSPSTSVPPTGRTTRYRWDRVDRLALGTSVTSATNSTLPNSTSLEDPRERNSAGRGGLGVSRPPPPAESRPSNNLRD